MSFIIFIFIAFIKVIKTAERFGLFREIVLAAGLRWLAGTEVGRLAGEKKRRRWKEETVKSCLNYSCGRLMTYTVHGDGWAHRWKLRSHPSASPRKPACCRPVLAHLASEKHRGTWNLGGKGLLPKSLEFPF